MLVLASDTDEYYIQLQAFWRRYMNSSPDIDCYFYKGDPTMSEEARLDAQSNILYLKINECMENVCEKTKRAFAFFAPNFHRYDFIYRTNLSSFIIFDRYIKYCNTISAREDFCSAVIGDAVCKFPSGSGYTISPNLALRFTEGEYDDAGFIDDVSLGACLQQWGIPIHPAKRLEFHIAEDKLTNNIDDDSIYHYRIKSFTTHDEDSALFEFFINKFYSGRSQIDKCYQEKCMTPSDINEHLPTLYSYALKCNTIIECGVRNIVSSYAFAKGLLTKHNRYYMVDPYKSEHIDIFLNMCKKEGINAEFIHGSDLDCQRVETDLLFIDTWHIYGQLKRELNYWHTYVKKYIILHDTTVDEWVGETIRNGWDAQAQSQSSGFPVDEINKGLWPAVNEFLVNNKNWVVTERFFNNNGLTILSRV
jgi:hypothetical protein